MSTADTFSPGLSPHGVKGGDPAEGLGGGLPASLPDEAYLTRLANEMFAQAPGGVPPGLNPGGLKPSGLQGGAPSSPSLAADAPGLGAVGMMSNSNLRPSAHWRFHSRHGGSERRALGHTNARGGGASCSSCAASVFTGRSAADPGR